MKYSMVILCLAALMFPVMQPDIAECCSSLMVTPGASIDGASMITHTCDAEAHGGIAISPAADHQPGEMIDYGPTRGKIPQVPHTYKFIRGLNEFQLAISETTAGGREELINPQGTLEYWDLMGLSLQRAKTAREAITVFTTLAEEYGYRSSAESISIGDTKEVWILEIAGTGPGGKGAVWVARRVPDGYICFTANKLRISDFPLNDPENCLYSKNAISFAVEKGYYDPNSGKPFSFCEAYCPANPANSRYADTRVWSIFRRAAPSLNLSSDVTRFIPGAVPLPLWVRPDKKLSVADVFTLKRDHYEGTEFDMTKGIDAGPYGTPDRWRPMLWKVDGNTYSWERPVGCKHSCTCFVTQSRGWLPDEIGGVIWFGVDDIYTTCLFPIYSCSKEISKPYSTGNLTKFSWDSAWWTFNFVANFAEMKWSSAIKDIQSVQSEIEGKFFALQPAVEKTALELYKTDKDLAADYLTDYTVSHGDMIVKRWKQLGEHIIQKYNDGYLIDGNGNYKETGYPEEWLREVVKENPDQFRIPK